MDAAAFVRTHTALGVPPYLPEIRLHLAADAFALWEQTEREAGGGGVTAPPFWAFPWAGGQALARHLLGDPGRAYLPRQRLRQLATYEVPVVRALEDAQVKRATVWSLS